MGSMGKLVYPLIGLLVLGTYVYTVRRGIEPLEVSSQRRELPSGPAGRAAGGYRHPRTSVFWFGGSREFILEGFRRIKAELDKL